MKRILGLDLGSGSIGWAVIDYSDKIDELSIIALGSQPLQVDGQTLSKFTTGQSVTINADRTAKRTARKMLDRHQARKQQIYSLAKLFGVNPNVSKTPIAKEELWALRAKAVTEKLTLEELYRVLIHLSAKRGYNASKSDLASTDNTTKGYVADVRNRYQQLVQSGLTIGQYYYAQLKDNPNFRIKERVLPRQAYIDEYDAIMSTQAKHYPDVLTDQMVKKIRDHILFYQRPLRSCKHLVSRCEFESHVIVRDDKEITIGPKVAHRSNPLFQLCRIYQVINALDLKNKFDINEAFDWLPGMKGELIKHLQTHPKLKVTDINKILFDKTRQSEWMLPDSIGNGIPGNIPLLQLRDALGKKFAHLLRFEINFDDVADMQTGEVRKKVSDSIISQPLYRLWHTVYSISNPDDLRKTLRSHKDFMIDDEEVIEKLVAIDFSNMGYANMSEKAIKRILPYLMQGMVYSDACAKAGINHSGSITAEEEAQRDLADKLVYLKKGELRQPIVEKILNQTVGLVNDLIQDFGSFDEIHIELARELKQNKDKRSESSKRIRENERINEAAAERVRSEFGMAPSRARITKVKLWNEAEYRCMYCQAPVSLKEFLEGMDAEVEHIIPKSLLFDDSFANKVCSCRKCNHEKDNRTAYDFMATKGEKVLREYQERINRMKEEKKISKTKHDYLLMPSSEIPEDFIDRQLRESQYIAKKAMEMLRTICHNVMATTGSVTDFLRHNWGWDQVLHNLNVDRYALADLVELRKDTVADQVREEIRIKDWSKRCDHRHHAIDALVIACTNRSIIQRLNTLASQTTYQFTPFLPSNEKSQRRLNTLERFALSLPHFDYSQVMDAVANILVAFKPEHKLTSTSKRYTYSGGKRTCRQRDIVVPRGALHEETIHGKIRRYGKDGVLEERTVTKYPLSSIKNLKDAANIVDKHIREIVSERLRTTPKDPFVQPLYSDAACTQQIRSVRCFSNLTSTVTVKRDQDGRAIGFAKPGANHHVAIYEDKEGKLQEYVSTFYSTVERARLGLPVIITDPSALWDKLMNDPDCKLDQEALSALPRDDWKFRFSMQRNDMFIIGLTRDEVIAAIEAGDNVILGAHLYRVQKLSSWYYCFSLHTQTQSTPSEFNKPDKRFIRVASSGTLAQVNPIKVNISRTGKISLV